MKVTICENPAALGMQAAEETAKLLSEAIARKGEARLLVSTGASQFTLFEALVKQPVAWECVEMFHLDEYIGMPETHPASFVGYLKQRFTSKVSLRAAHFLDDTADTQACIARMTAEIRKAPIDVGLIGIGENAHIAFNDPPADFEDTAAYKVVALDDACRHQQYGEGWFATLEDVPKTALSMTVHQIMLCEKIISCVPYAVKAEAIAKTLGAPEVTNEIPATILRTHPCVSLYLDKDSASLLKDQ